MTRPRTTEPDRALCASVLSALRNARGPLTTRQLADRFRCHSRRISEALADLRKSGWRITLDSHGHTLVRGRRQIEPTLRRMRVRVAEMMAALRGMERGRPPQSRLPVTRERRSAA